MEAIKISQLPKKAELTGEETIPASTGTKETNRITARQIADLASSTPGPVGPQGPQGPQGEPGPQGPKGDTGATGPAGKDGAAGPAGPQGERGPEGPQGPRGEQGEPGAGISITGEVETYADLPTNLTEADAGKAYIVKADGLLYIWSGTSFPADGGGTKFVGPRGPQGPEGPPGPQGKPGADAEVPIVQETGNSVSNTMSQKAITDALSAKQNTLTPEQLDAVNSGASAATIEQVSANQAQIASVKELIPDTATVDNPLTDKNFVNSSINAVAAYLITADAQGAPFSTHAALESATTFYSSGQERVPTQNDYCIVLADENYDGATTRYSYQGEAGSGVWAFAYKVNDSPLTAAQVAALESGITASLVEKYNGYAGQIADKANSADVPVITMTTTDPGEGSDLAVGQFIAVYDGATE